MPKRTWRERLAQAAERDGRPLRAISLAAGLKENSLWEMLNTEKEPGIERILAVAPVLGVSASWILEGIELSPETSRLLKAWGQMPKAQQEALLRLLETQNRR